MFNTVNQVQNELNLKRFDDLKNVRIAVVDPRGRLYRVNSIQYDENNTGMVLITTDVLTKETGVENKDGDQGTEKDTSKNLF